MRVERSVKQYRASKAMEGNAAEALEAAHGGAGLLIIDMINNLDFPGGETLQPKAEAVADVIRGLREQAEQLGVPTIYVNDNYGQWRSETSGIVETCGAPGSRGAGIVERLAPNEGDYFVIKPQVSGFYATSLPALLPRLGVGRLVITGIAADICVLFTAAGAHMREYQVWAPKDAVASVDDQRADWALSIMRDSMRAETRPTTELTLKQWLDSATG